MTKNSRICQEPFSQSRGKKVCFWSVLYNLITLICHKTHLILNPFYCFRDRGLFCCPSISALDVKQQQMMLSQNKLGRRTAGLQGCGRIQTTIEPGFPIPSTICGFKDHTLMNYWLQQFILEILRKDGTVIHPTCLYRSSVHCNVIWKQFELGYDFENGRKYVKFIQRVRKNAQGGL